MKFPGSRFLALLKAGDKGTVAVTFLLSFPIFLAIVGLLVLSRGHAHLRPSLRNLPRILLAGLVAAAPALIPGIPTLVLVVVATAIYAGMLLLLGAIPDELIDGLWRKRSERRRGTDS